MEIRGQGIVRRPFVSPALIDLVVDLVPLASCGRVPAADEESGLVEASRSRVLRLPIGAGDGPVRVRAQARLAMRNETLNASL